MAKVKALKTKTSQTSAGKDSPLLKEVKQIYKFMQDNNLASVSYEQKGVSVKLERMAPARVAVPVLSEGAPSSSQEAQAISAQYAQTIKSPLMGIFFRGASPSAPPFVREGDKIKAGTPICLIEAMKVFNEVKAASDCIIQKVLVENGQPVKPGDLLFAIEKI